MGSLPQQVSESVRRRNPHLYQNPLLELETERVVRESKPRIRQSSKPLMNQIESDFYEWLTGGTKDPSIHIQSINLRLANGTSLRPDFFSFKRSTAWEIKGRQEIQDDAVVKLKCAAALYPDIQFLLMWRDREGQWQSQIILP